MEHLITLDDITGEVNLTREQTMELRSQYIPKSCKLHFDKSPMKVVRASGQYLYDDEGSEFLDCVNCVAHIGHCNPTVVESAKTAMLKMGNVSLGMTDVALEYVSKLKTSFPPEIDTFLFVSSASEANDVAIQMARLYSGGYDVVSVERSFHGGLSVTNNISPRQFTNEEKCPNWVHVLECPDLYRGKYRETDAKAVEKYCQNAKEVMENAVKKQRKLACFICEPIITIAGVIMPPSTWIHSVYNEIRSHGGLAIADEAQCGLGRPGVSMWCFQVYENLLPDIITIGKPLGNGHPMACICTRSSIAATLGSETLGNYTCDLVSAAVGQAVFNTVRSQSLQLNARTVGEFLREGIRALGTKHQNIGLVRGTGLMVGVEIVYNQESRKPARDLAEKICYKLLEHYIIVANDGIHKNVLIFTPPMLFTCENAHRVIVALGKVLSDIENSGIDESDSNRDHSASATISGERLISFEEVGSVIGGANIGMSSLERGGAMSGPVSYLDEMDNDDGGYGTSTSFACMD